MLVRMSSFNFSSTSTPQNNGKDSRKPGSIPCNLPPKIPKLDLNSSCVYSKIFANTEPENHFVPPDPDSVPDISFVVSPGIDAIKRFRKPVFTPENSPVNLSLEEYQKMLRKAKSGILTVGAISNDTVLALRNRHLSKSSISASAASKSMVLPPETSKLIITPTEADKSAEEWCSKVSNTTYLCSDWISKFSLTNQNEDERIELETKTQFYENQRKIAYEQFVSNLEQRMACLMQSPPILPDPYLKPVPIPRILPHRELGKPGLPILANKQKEEVKYMFAKAGSDLDAVLVQSKRFRIKVTLRDINTLTGNTWLNDVVVNFYLQLIAHRSRQCSDMLRVLSFSSFFFTHLTSVGYSGVRRWTRSTDLFSHDLVLIPIHDRGMHWCLACVDFRKQTVSYYDSLHGYNDRCLETILEYLDSESKDKRKKPLEDISSWKKLNMNDVVPPQENGSDCGVFACATAEFLSRDADFIFDQSDMPEIRQRMIYEILTVQLLNTGTNLADDP
ncbi:hypothetical protein Aperf_G00000106688 [Anoplocephala perfoliata]